MRRLTLLAAAPFCLALGLLGAGCDDDDDSNIGNGDDALMLAASPLSGDNVVPPVDTDATGAVVMEIDGTVATYTVDLQSITEVESAAIHSGAPDANGPPRVTLYAGPMTGPVDGTLVQSTFAASDVQGLTFDQLVEEMRNGSAYVAVRTVEFPDGELRAQIETVE